MPGRVPFSEVSRYYSLVDVVVLPRYKEQVTDIVSPIKPFEAMAMSKCIVVSDVRALAEIVTQDVTGRLFEQGNAKSLRDVLDPLLTDDDLRQKLGAQAREWVVQNRSWDRTTRVMHEDLATTLRDHAEAIGQTSV